MSEKYLKALEAYPSMQHYGDFHEFQSKFIPKPQSFHYGKSDLPFDLLYAPSPGSKRLAVFFNSQQKPGELRLFTWQKVSRAFSANRLFIADPLTSKHENLNLGWYAGGRAFDLQEHLRQVIEFFRESTDAAEIIFFGSSGGGFPAILYSQLFTNAMAVTLQPTTTVLRHSNTRLVEAWLNLAWDAPLGELKNIASARTLDIPDRFPDGLDNPVLILQNSDDTDFIESQSRPLFRALGGDITSSETSIGNLHLRLEKYGNGHTPPPPSRIERLAQRISAIPIGSMRSGDYSAILRETLL